MEVRQWAASAAPTASDAHGYGAARSVGCQEKRNQRIATYPVRLTGPLEGKQINVGRVALYECRACGHLMPTPAGQAKVARNVDLGIRLFLGQLS